MQYESCTKTSTVLQILRHWGCPGMSARFAPRTCTSEVAAPEQSAPSTEVGCENWDAECIKSIHKSLLVSTSSCMKMVKFLAYDIAFLSYFPFGCTSHLFIETSELFQACCDTTWTDPQTPMPTVHEVGGGC